MAASVHERNQSIQRLSPNTALTGAELQAQNGSQELVDRILALARAALPDATIDLAEYQGGCSVTMKVVQQQKPYILQVRPDRFSIDLEIVHAAREVYGLLVPETILLGYQSIGDEVYQVVTMEYRSGIPCSQMQLSERALQRLVEGLADTFALSWRSPATKSDCNGTVGSSIEARLLKLSIELPDNHMRQMARQALASISYLDRLPIVLTHGDLLPSNILCDSAGKLTGLIDWAEAEYLPFGVALYGLDRMLLLYGCSLWGPLRDRFWARLTRSVPELENLRNSLDIARMVGILLWHGFAWDDGRIDRVIDGSNVEELTILRTLLPPSAAG